MVIGSAGTGKSCILHQFIEGKCKLQRYLCQIEHNAPERCQVAFFFLHNTSILIRFADLNYLTPFALMSLFFLFLCCFGFLSLACTRLYVHLKIVRMFGSQARLQPHYWCRIRLQGSQCWWQVCEVANLGHSWTGKIQVNLSKLLLASTVYDFPHPSNFYRYDFEFLIFIQIPVSLCSVWLSTSFKRYAYVFESILSKCFSFFLALAVHG